MYYRFIFALFIMLSSCKTEQEKEVSLEEVSSIEITSISNDSISIRALERAGNGFWFAGSKGAYGSIADSTMQVSKGSVVYKDYQPLEFRSIAVTSSFTFILTAGNPGLIYRISHENDSLALVYEEIGETVFYDSMKFWNDTDGVALGDPQEDCFTVLITNDGGESWNKISCDVLPKIKKGEAAYAASNSNIELQGDQIWIVTGGMASRVLHSADRGKSWEVLETPIVKGGEMTGIYAIDFYDENLGAIMGGDWNQKDESTSNKAITKDGGKTWNLLSDGKGPGYNSDISFVPGTGGNELIAVGSPGIWWSGDQGTSWKKLSDQGFYTVSFKDSNSGMLAGSNQISSFQLIRN
ncbi:WD40/YVTN/BNR-like repeat-containing protein [Nonlabens antarcticus]|uniref:WD40/YVTN/BNR-like repeat-containing protein n=1 Tax=Nonlabens antarcticus TaxID=392714 RepID=UPI001890BC7F|nr:YCF48-related protein [Nonlabens antarcticus]